MYRRVVVCFFMLIGLTLNAQTINLRGIVSNSTGKPITNAIVTLVKQAMKDTTGTDGAYTLSKGTGIELPLLKPNSQSITLYKNFLDFSLPNPAPVKVEVFDVKGNLLQKMLLQNASTGFYRFNITENSRTAQLLVMRASIGKESVTLRYLPVGNGNYAMNQSNEGANLAEKTGLSKITAINDTLLTTATGYTEKSVAINSYDQALNISLDTLGAAAKPSAGCGKARTLADSSSTSIPVDGSSRHYILSIPHDYDPNTPYALWFAIHGRGGNADGVAHGSFGTNYQYFGMRKFANPANGKGTTIFCAPDGAGGMWASGTGDLDFFRAMITKFETELCIDKSRIFASGFSMGGSMSYALACAMPDTFKAVAMHSGGGMSGCDGSHRGPVPMFITHGIKDPTNTYPANGIPQIVDMAQRDGCTAMDIPSLPNQPTDPTGLNPVCTSYKNCKAGYPCRACIFYDANQSPTGAHTPSPGPVHGNDWGEASTWVPDSTWSYFRQFY